MNGDKPVVTIIVADSGDDPDRDTRLARSTASVAKQSLRGVQLLVTDDSRSRADALDEAAGEFVVFLTSGNVLDRHAARTAVGAAQDSGADVVSGRWTRPGGAALPSRQPVFRRTATYAGLADRPDLLHDTVFDNKVFRTRFAQANPIRLGSDGAAVSMGFVTAAYLRATGITVVPQRVLVQHVEPHHPDPAELLDVHAALDRLIADAGRPEIGVAKDLRFLEVDLPRFLLAVAGRDDADARQLLERLGAYVDFRDPAALAAAGKLVQLAVFLVRSGDVAGAVSAAEFLARDRRLSAALAERSGRVYWSDRHLDTAEGRAVTDVTALGFHELPLAQLRPAARVDDLRVRGATAQVRGRLVNPLARIPAQDAQLALAVVAVGTDRRTSVPVRVVEHSSEVLRWEATLDLPAAVHPGWRGHRDWAVELCLTASGQTAGLPLSADPALTDRRLLTRARWSAVGNTLTTATTREGDLLLRLVPQGHVGARIARFGARVLRRSDDADEPSGRPSNAAVPTGSLRTKARALRFVFARLPQRRRSVVFESHMGLGYSDNPRYICEELQRRDAGFDVVWSFADEAPPVPPGVRTVRRGSWRHMFALARAGFWVDNQGLPQAIQKPARVTYLQTWHGSALKRMGEDTPAFARLSPDRQERHRRAVQRWDYFVARSEHDVRTLVPALHVRGKVLRTGYPRNDPLVQMRSAEQRAVVRTELGLPPDKTLVLYAPTFRETYESGLQDFELPIDLDQFFDALPDHRLLVRTHYLQRLQLPAATHAVVRDVSSMPDITPLLVAADVLITDYSSVLFDFANTGRPMLFYVYDYDDYAHSERGVYWELADKAPGPLVRTSDELINALATVDAWRPDYETRYHDFVNEFGEYDTGSAARQIVDSVFLGTTRDE